LVAVQARAPAGVKVSTHDVAAGMLWCLRCAMAGAGLPGEPCSGRFIVALDLATNGLPDVLPADWTGNCAAALSVDPGLALPGDGTPLAAFTAAAVAIRRAVTAYRNDARNAIEHILNAAARDNAVWRAVVGTGSGGARIGEGAAPLVGYATSSLRVPMAALDCGTGAPVALHYSTLPLRSAAGLLFGSLAPGPRGDGVLLLFAASKVHTAALLDSDGRAAELLRAVPGATTLL